MRQLAMIFVPLPNSDFEYQKQRDCQCCSDYSSQPKTNENDDNSDNRIYVGSLSHSIGHDEIVFDLLNDDI